MSKLKDFRNRRAFSKAKKEASENETVCAVIGHDGAPIYFVAPKDASDDLIRELAFLHREGRSMSKIERRLLEMAEQRKGTDGEAQKGAGAGHAGPAAQEGATQDGVGAVR